MPKLKLDQQRTIIAAKGAQFLFAVHIKVKYGWTGDLDTTLLVLANTHEQARRAAAARLVVKEGISLPLDDNHFSETLVGAVERAAAEPEMSREEFSRLWQHVDAKFRHNAVPDQHIHMVHICDCQREFLDPAEHAQDCPYRVEYGDGRALVIKTDGVERMRLPAQD